MAGVARFIETFVPAHYDLRIDINRETKVIAGTTTIYGEAKNTTVKVHEHDLTVSAVQLLDEGTGVLTPAEFVVTPANDEIAITVPATGRVAIVLDYTAPLTDKMMGIYPSYYELNGERKSIIGTQFETNFARQAFPSVDEPEAKATFTLALSFDEEPGETVLGNMPEVKVEAGVHYFEETRRMSTYLVAFAFGDLQAKRTKTTSGVEVGVFSTKAHQPAELDFALDIAKRSIEFYEDYYQTPYPLPHSWQLALPDFSAGAMENWGLVTYREVYLLVDSESTPLSMQQGVATVIAHELAHQWFGDLVTMQWWDDLWLNESFANMMEYVAIDALEPDWHIWDSFRTTEIPMSLSRDATDGVQSVHVAVNYPEEIDTLFDAAIVYAKGARLLVMLRKLIGDAALRKGLKNYFAKHQYGNAQGADLWAELGAVTDYDVTAIMQTWLDQPGYPVLSVAEEANQLVIRQEQFFIGDHVDQHRLWQVPLNSNYMAVPEILATTELKIPNYTQLRDQAAVPFRVNVDDATHVVVQYDKRILHDILAHPEELLAGDKLQILKDLRYLAQAQRISYAEVVPLLERFATDSSRIVNEALLEIVDALKVFFTPGTPEYGRFQALVAKLTAFNVARLGWEKQATDSNDDVLLRPEVLSAALLAEVPDEQAQAHALYERYADNLQALPADVRGLVLKNEVKQYYSKALFDKLLQAYQATPDTSYQMHLRAGLTSVEDPTAIAELLTVFKDNTVIKPQDLRGWATGLLNNPVGEQPIWDWLRTEWAWIEDTLGGDMSFTSYITMLARTFKTPVRLAEFKEFFEPKLAQPGLTREIEMDTNVIAARVALIAAEQAAVYALFN